MTKWPAYGLADLLPAAVDATTREHVGCSEQMRDLVQTYLRPGELTSADVIYVEETAWKRHGVTPKDITSGWRLERAYKRVVVYDGTADAARREQQRQQEADRKLLAASPTPPEPDADMPPAPDS